MATQGTAQPSPRPPSQPHRENRHPRSHPHQDRQSHPRGQAPHGGSRGGFNGDRGPRPPRRGAPLSEQAPQAAAVATAPTAASPAAQPEAPVDLSFGLPAPHVIGTQDGVRVLCVAEIRGQISLLNKLARENNAQAIIHTGDFGFYESDSLERISDRTLRHLVEHSPLIPVALRSRLLAADVPGSRGGSVQSSSLAPSASTPCREMRSQMLAHPDSPLLSEFPKLLSGEVSLDVPVYTVWGACEDVRILEKIQMKEYIVPNLHIISEASSVALEVGGLRLRLYGLGGALVMHKLFDTGEGASTIAGGQGLMWTTLLQIGELIDTAQKSYDPSEVRILVTHASPGREGLLMQLASALKADYTISAGLYFRYGVSYNEFCVQNDTEGLRKKFLQSKSAFSEVWDSVQAQLDNELDAERRILLNNALAITNRIPNVATPTGAVYEEPIYKNTWNWNLPDASSGHLVLDVRQENICSEMKSQGFNFAHRRAMAVAAAAEAAAKAAEEAEARAAATAAAVQQAAARREAAAHAASKPAVAPSPATQKAYPPREQKLIHARGQNTAHASPGHHAANGAGTPQERTGNASKQYPQQQQVNGTIVTNADGSVETGRPLAPKGKKVREEKRATTKTARDSEATQSAQVKPAKHADRSASSSTDTPLEKSIAAANSESLAPSAEAREGTAKTEKRSKRKTNAERKAAALARSEKSASGAEVTTPAEAAARKETIAPSAAPASAAAPKEPSSDSKDAVQMAAVTANGAGSASADADASAIGQDGSSSEATRGFGRGRGRGRGGRGRGGRGGFRGRGGGAAGGKPSGAAPAAAGGN